MSKGVEVACQYQTVEHGRALGVPAEGQCGSALKEDCVVHVTPEGEARHLGTAEQVGTRVDLFTCARKLLEGTQIQMCPF